MRASFIGILCFACADDLGAKSGAGPGLLDPGDTGEVDDTGDSGDPGVDAPEPAWVQVGSARVLATHVVLASVDGAADPAGMRSLTLETRGWGEIEMGGQVGWGDATEPLMSLDVVLSAAVDVQAYNDGRVVPPEVCDDFAAAWALDSVGAAADSAMVPLNPLNGERCVVEGTQRPPLLRLGFGDSAWVSFSAENLSISLVGYGDTCTLTVHNLDEETLSRDVSCASTLQVEDGSGDAAPGAARVVLAEGGARLVVGVVAGTSEVVAGQ